MAITITQQPPNAAPSSNSILVRATSNNTAQANFRLVCDIRNAANTTTIARLKADLIPGTTGTFFDIAPILRSLVTTTNPNVVTAPAVGTTAARAGWLDMPNSAYQYQVDLYEEWGTPPSVQTGTKVSITGKIAFQGAFDTDQTWAWIDTVRYPNAYDTINGHKALTDYGGNTDLQKNRTVPSLSYGAISIGTRPAGNWERALITYFVGATQIRQYFVWMPTASISAFINSFACYPLNLRALPAGSGSTVKNACSDGFSGDYNFVGAGGSYYVTSYTVQFVDDAGASGATYTFLVDPCDKWSQPTNAAPAAGTPKTQAGPIHIHWWNDYGGTDTWIFRMKNRRRQEVASRVTYGANSDTFGTTVADRIYGGTYADAYTLNTDWLTDAEFILLAGLMRSPRVWLDDGITPTKEASIVPTSFTEFTRMTDRLKQVQLDILIATKNPMI
jgi:hypothetical protein